MGKQKGPSYSPREQMRRFVGFGILSMLASACTISYALSKKGTFFNACIHISRSSFSILILMISMVYCFFLVGWSIRKLLFGELRLIEIEHIWENSYFTISEIFLAVTIFRGEFNISFAFSFCFLLLVKIFHWIFKDRVDYLEQTANTSNSFIARLGFTFGVLFAIDVIGILTAWKKFFVDGPSIMILFGTEYAVLMVYLLQNTTKMIFHLIDLYSADGAPWEEKSSFIFYLELACDFFKVAIYLTFFALVTKFYGLPFHIIRDLYFSVKSFVGRIRDLYRYRQAVSNLENKYPNATPEELQNTDRICIICRDEMQEAKKLPCGHYFHLSCLKSWIERQQVCPTCRAPIFQNAPSNAEAVVAEETEMLQTPTRAQPEQQQLQQNANFSTINGLPIVLLPNGQIGIWNTNGNSNVNVNFSLNAQSENKELFVGTRQETIQRIENKLLEALSDLQKLKEKEE
jgi:hypothetical protein